MGTYSFGHFFDNNHQVTLPYIGTLEVNKIMPRYDVQSNTFDPPKFKVYFTQNLTQQANESWLKLNNYLNSSEPKQVKDNMLNDLNAGNGMHIIGIGTLVRMPLEGYDFIDEPTPTNLTPKLPAQLFLNANRTHTINAGGQSYTNVQMQTLLNTAAPKKTKFWLFSTLGILLLAAIGVGIYFYINGFKF